MRDPVREVTKPKQPFSSKVDVSGKATKSKPLTAGQEWKVQTSQAPLATAVYWKRGQLKRRRVTRMLIQLALLRMYSHVTRGLWGTLGKGTLVADRSQHTLSGCIGLFPLVVFWKQIAGDVHVSSRDRSIPHGCAVVCRVYAPF